MYQYLASFLFNLSKFIYCYASFVNLESFSVEFFISFICITYIQGQLHPKCTSLCIFYSVCIFFMQWNGPALFLFEKIFVEFGFSVVFLHSPAIWLVFPFFFKLTIEVPRHIWYILLLCESVFLFEGQRHPSKIWCKVAKCTSCAVSKYWPTSRDWQNAGLPVVSLTP